MSEQGLDVQTAAAIEDALCLTGDLNSWPLNTTYRLDRKRILLAGDWSAVLHQLLSPPLELTVVALPIGGPELASEPRTGVFLASSRELEARLRLEVIVPIDVIEGLQPSRISLKLNSTQSWEEQIEKVTLNVRGPDDSGRIGPKALITFMNDIGLEGPTDRLVLDFDVSEQHQLSMIATIARRAEHQSFYLAFTFRRGTQPFQFGDVRLERAALRSTPAPRAAEAQRNLDKLTDRDLIRLASVVQEEVFQRVKPSFSAQDWGRIQGLRDAALPRTRTLEKLLTMIGRAAIQDGKNASAISPLSIASALFPGNIDVQMYRGVAQSRAGRHDDAVATLRSARDAAPANFKIVRELGNALREDGRATVDQDLRRAKEAEAITCLLEALDQEFVAARAISAGRLLLDHQRFDEALALAERAAATQDDRVNALVLASRALVALGRVSEALKTSERILDIEPNNESARYQLRVFRFLADAEPTAPPSMSDFDDGLGCEDRERTGAFHDDLRRRLIEDPHDYLTLPGQPRVASLSHAERNAFAGSLTASSGFYRFHGTTCGDIGLWRREALLNLLESGLLDTRDPWAGIERFESVYAAGRRPFPLRPSTVLLSRHGSFKFGGGEHFLAAMAEHYGSLGHDPIILGTRKERVGETGEIDGVRFAFIDGTAAALRRFFLTDDVRFVHVLSGLGFQVSEALHLTNIPFVYGVHYWREALGTSEESAFFDPDGQPVPRPEFAFVLARAAMVYANSEFTRDVLETAYGVRCPVVLSVPPNLATGRS